MPKCQKCFDYLPPDYFIEREDGGKICMFCETDKDKLTLEKDNHIKYINKKELKEEYRIFLKKLLESENVKKFVKGEEENLIIKPGE